MYFINRIEKDNWSKKHCFIHCRGWGYTKDTHIKQFHYEFCISKTIDNWFSISVTRGGEYYRELSVNVGIIGISLYLSFYNILPDYLMCPKPDSENKYEESSGRETCIRLYNNLITVKFNSTEDKIKNDKFSFKRHWFIDNLLFGKSMYAEHELDKFMPHKIEVCMPEGVYSVLAKRVDRYYWYSRMPKVWPFFRHIVNGDFEVLNSKGIPFPGKGESSWDCGDDGLFSGGVTINDNDSEEVLYKKVTTHITDYVNEQRTKHGSGPGMYVGKLVPSELKDEYKHLRPLTQEQKDWQEDKKKTLDMDIKDMI